MKLAVVFVSYWKVPIQRLRDHFAWNAEIYRAFGDRICVYVVSDIDHELPTGAKCVIYPMDRLPVIDGQPRFSLTRTKNAGIRQALEDGADVIVSTDVDIAFDSTLFRLAQPTESQAMFPFYRMVWHESAAVEGYSLVTIDNGCTGTTAMSAANWRKVSYDDRCVMYGGDDGILLRDCQQNDLTVVRDELYVTHVYHSEKDRPREPGTGSEACYGRDDGFNGVNLRNNQRACRRARYHR